MIKIGDKQLENSQQIIGMCEFISCCTQASDNVTIIIHECSSCVPSTTKVSHNVHFVWSVVEQCYICSAIASINVSHGFNTDMIG